MNREVPGSRSTLAFAGTVLATLASFRVLDIAIGRLAQLPPAAYFDSFFLDDLPARWWRLVSSRVPWWLLLACVVLGIGAFVVDARVMAGVVRRRLLAPFAGWRDLEDGASLRWLIVAVTGIAAWSLSCYPQNQYVGRLHAADRLIVLALWAGIAWRPLFVLPFAVAAGAVAGQFVVPLGFISWTEMALVLRLPLLVAAFWIVRAVTRDRTSDALIFVWCCLLATTYWTSGLGKIRIEWLTHPHVDLLLLGAYANGWLAFVEPSVVERSARVVAALAMPLMVATMVIECGSLVLLWRRWSLVGFIALATLFHLSAFAMTGIFFWKWIVVDMFFLTYLLRGRRMARIALFTPGRFALSVAVILAGPVWVTSENLTWLDTPLTYSLRFEGVDTAGATHALPAGFFRPYSDAIVLGTFPGVSPHPQLTRGMGVSMDRGLADALVKARSEQDIVAIEAARGVARYDANAAAAFDDFVARHAANARCATEREPFVLRTLGAPRHLWTFPLDAEIPCGVALTRVHVVELTTFFDGRSLRVIRRRPLREIDVASRVGRPVP